jgi:hypothetical protein
MRWIEYLVHFKSINSFCVQNNYHDMTVETLCAGFKPSEHPKTWLDRARLPAARRPASHHTFQLSWRKLNILERFNQLGMLEF